MKTLIVYEEVPEKTMFFLVDGDRSDLQDKFINMVDCEMTAQQSDELGEPQKHFGPEIAMPLTYVGDKIIVVHCGFLL